MNEAVGRVEGDLGGQCSALELTRARSLKSQGQKGYRSPGTEGSVLRELHNRSVTFNRGMQPDSGNPTGKEPGE